MAAGIHPKLGIEVGIFLLLAVFAVEHVAHDAAAFGSGFLVVLEACGGGERGVRFCFWLAAGGTAIGEAGLVGLQLEFFTTDGAGTNWEGHFLYSIKTGVGPG
jgi:hypothetical protein